MRLSEWLAPVACAVLRAARGRKEQRASRLAAPGPRSPQSGARPPPLLLSAQVRALPWAPCALLRGTRRVERETDERGGNCVTCLKYNYYLLYGENLLVYLLLRLRPTSHSRRRALLANSEELCQGSPPVEFASSRVRLAGRCRSRSALGTCACSLRAQRAAATRWLRAGVKLVTCAQLSDGGS